MTIHFKPRSAGFVMCLALLPAAASAQAVAPVTNGVAGLATSATVEVPKDQLMVVMTTSRDGTDASTVQAQLKQALDAALAEAKKSAKPTELEVQTGGFSIYPKSDGKGVNIGWQGSAELVIEGRDMQGIAQLTGRVKTMTIARVSYSLSREVRERVEGDVSAQAIARFRARAADTSKQFGYTGYTIREVTVSTGMAEGAPTPMVRMNAMKFSASSDAPLPVEAGKGSVTVSVNGTIQMK